jgi:hypothetical protein
LDEKFVADAMKSARKRSFTGDSLIRMSGTHIMLIRSFIFAGTALALSSCTTVSISPKNPVETRWIGQSAGSFFAKFGPPASDVAAGSQTLYTWKGGYKNSRIPAQYAKGEDGKRGKQIAPAKTVYLSCGVQLTTDDDYMIKRIAITSDRPGVEGPSYCAEFLGGE